MKRILSALLFLISFTQLNAQTEDVQAIIQPFPYQRTEEAATALTSMQNWNSNQWNQLFGLLDDDSLKLKASYALSAYTHQSATNSAQKTQMATNLVAGLAKVKSYYAKELIIKYLSLLGDDAAVKPLSKLLSDNEQADNAARALVTIHSPAAMAALQKALAKAKEPNRKYIETVLNFNKQPLPAIKTAAAIAVEKQNPVQQLLSLQDQLEKATDPIRKKRILNQVSRIPGISSFVLVSAALSDKEVATDAARILAQLALNDKQIHGPLVRAELEKALPLIKGEDSAILVKKLTAHIKAMPYDNGFVSLFNGKDLSGWKALVGNPILRARMSADSLVAAQNIANEKAKNDWIVKDGLLVFTGHGDNLCTEKKYGDIEMFVDWKITEKGDAGIYLRGSPQVQIWDTSRREVGAQVGSGGLYNNQKNPSKPLVVADNRIGEWNRFHIIMKGERVTVYLNGQLVTDNVVLENYWDRKQPIFPKEQLELQAHGTYVAYRNIFVRELPTDQTTPLSEEEKKQGFSSLFDGTNLEQWTGNTTGYLVEEGNIVVHPELSGGNLYTKEEYADFNFRFEFQLTPGANNGLGIRAPMQGDAAYVGMELQILDNEAEIYKNLQPYQYHGSVYGVIPAKRGFLKPTGEWNLEEVIVKGSKVTVILNGETILDGDIKQASANGTMDHKEHPGLQRTSGHIGFLGHGDVLRFRNIRVKRL